MKDPARNRRGIFVYSIISILTLASLCIFAWCLRSVILPMCIGVLLAYLCKPLKTVFNYRGIPKGTRITILFCLLIGVLLSGINFVKNNFPNDKEKLEIMVRMKYHFNKKIENFKSSAPGIYRLLSKDIDPLERSLNRFLTLSEDQRKLFIQFHNGVPGFKLVPENFYNYFLENLKTEPHAENTSHGGDSHAVEFNDLESLSEGRSFVRTVFNFFSIWFLLPLVFLFFFLDNGGFSQFFIRLVPNRYFEVVLTVKAEVDAAIGRYLRGVSLECVLVGISMVIGFFIIGVPIKVALLIGIVSGLCTAIPLVGPVVAYSLGLGFALVAEEIHPLLSFVGLDNLLLSVLLVTTLVLVLDKALYQPVALRGVVNLHPLIMILSLMVASVIFGISGTILGAPAIMIIKVIAEHSLRQLKDYRII